MTSKVALYVLNSKNVALVVKLQGHSKKFLNYDQCEKLFVMYTNDKKLLQTLWNYHTIQ